MNGVSDEKDLRSFVQLFKNQIQTYSYSSMGRLFDAVSSILDICHLSQYEGESAILLEQEASVGRNCRDSRGYEISDSSD